MIELHTRPILVPEKGKKKRWAPSGGVLEPSHWWAQNYMTQKTRLSPFLACANIPSEEEEERRSLGNLKKAR
jgi:hypothetical protein